MYCRDVRPAVIVLLPLAFLTTASARTTVPDRSVVTVYLEASGSAMRICDMNGDGGISDTDYAMLVDDRLIELYGEEYAVGDLDGDGFETTEDIVFAIKAILRASLGKISDGSTVTADDFIAAVEQLADPEIHADFNLDGEEDALDLNVPLERLDHWYLSSTLDDMAREILAYLDAFWEVGRGAFMALEPAPVAHEIGISDTWPPLHPDWWQPCHLVSNSRTYAPENHSSYDTEQNPNAHENSVSAQWPANHDVSPSNTWPEPPPPPHGAAFSVLGDPPAPPDHEASITEMWPAAHGAVASQTWSPKPSLAHDIVISRTWWPQHTRGDSRSMTWPPFHDDEVSWTWDHDIETSIMQWPPNHNVNVSLAWGQQHQMGISVHWPPSHVAYASTGWPGPQPAWPANHTASVSATWSEPSQTPWPIFPADHTWWDTVVEFPLTPRWPLGGGGPPVID